MKACQLLSSQLYPTMKHEDREPSAEVCKTGKKRGIKACVKCINSGRSSLENVSVNGKHLSRIGKG